MVPLEVGSVAQFNAMAFAPANQNTVQFLENRLMEKASALGGALTEFGQSFFTKAMNTFNEFHGADAMRAANAALRKAKTYFQANTIRPLTNLEELQTAPEKMLRFLMAEPETRELHQAQRIEGYEGRYDDMHPKAAPGIGHYDYDRVVQGVLMEDEENDFHVHIDMSPLEEGDADLNLGQQTDVMNAWDLIKEYRKNERRDGTSNYDTRL